MVRKSRGFRSGTRKKLRQKPKERPAITKFLQDFDSGDKVLISPEPASQRGMPFPRYKGAVGIVVGKRGHGYIVEVADGKMKKTIISKPEHLRRV